MECFISNMRKDKRQIEVKKREVYESATLPEWIDKRYEVLGLKPIEDIEMETIKSLLSPLEEEGNKRVLDIGCGAGRMVKMFPKEAFVGIDLCRNFLDYCRDNRQSEKTNFLMADLNHLPFKENSFDIILLIGTFESESAPAEKIAEILPYLKPMGKILFTLQNSRNIMARVANFFGQSYPKTYWPLHYLRQNFAHSQAVCCQIKSNFVVPLGILREMFRKLIKSSFARNSMVRPCVLLEKLNLRYNLNLGYEWKVCITRK